MTLSVLVKASQGLSCYLCGTVFWMSEDMYEARLRDHRDFWCPAGHSQVFTGETEEQKLRRQLKYAKDRTAAVEAERDQIEHSRRAWKGQATRLRNRAGKGECPLCGKHIFHLDRHMGRMHADTRYEAATETEEIGG